MRLSSYPKLLVGFLFLASVFFVACSDLPSDAVNMPNGYWLYEEPVKQTVEVKDAKQVGKHVLHLKVDDSYPLQNLWVHASFESTEADTQRFAFRQEFLLMDESGDWYAERSLGGTYQFQASLRDSTRFPSTGKWQVTLTQLMRVDTLQGVRAVGYSFMPQ